MFVKICFDVSWKMIKIQDFVLLNSLTVDLCNEWSDIVELSFEMVRDSA